LPEELRYPKWQIVLLGILSNQPISCSELARRLDISSSTLYNFLEPLKAMKLINCVSELHQTELTLTEKGKEIADYICKIKIATRETNHETRHI
jgi:Mn-dependent DtxR family transcriptional regulator